MAPEASPGVAADTRLRSLIPLVLFVLLIGVFGLTLWKISANRLDIREIKSPLIGKPAPRFDLPSVVDGAPRISNAAFAGQPYVVNVWGTWCPECRAEHGALLQIARLASVPLIGIDWKDDRDLARRWLSELGNPYTAVAVDDDGKAVIDWGVYGAPETFLVGADGRVLYKHVGAVTMEDWRNKFLPLIGDAPGGAAR